MNIKNGTYIVGECLGTKKVTNSNPNTGESFVKHFVGLQMPVKNGYDGQAVVVDIQFSKQAVDNLAMRQFDNLVGKQIMIPVNSMSRAYKDKAYTTHYIDLDRPVVNMTEEKPLSKAVNS